ncbi:MAG: enoyl-CoA hydratase/isomerase family protein, partial [Polyangiaceae bacterium]
LACDYRLVFDKANTQLGLPEVELGLLPGWGGTQRLPRIVGMGRAMDLILTGRFVKASECLTLGLANEVVPKGKSLERAMKLAKDLCALPQGAMRSDKQAAMMGWGRPLEEGLRIEAELGQYAISSRDMREGARAFVEKRKASFVQDDGKKKGT